MPSGDPPPSLPPFTSHVGAFIYIDPAISVQLQRIEDKLDSIMKELGFKQPSVRWDLPYNRDDAILDEQQ